MILEEFKNNQNQKWRKKVYKSSLHMAYIILVIEVLTFFAYLIMDVMDVSVGRYLIIRIAIPTLIDFCVLVAYKVVEKKPKYSDNTKNLMLAYVVLILCGVVSVFHNYYFVLWIAPTLAIFYSTLFNDERIMKTIFKGALVETFLAFLISMIEKNFDAGLTFSYLVVTIFFVVCEYLVAKRITAHYSEQQEVICNDILKQQKMLEKLELDPMTKLYNRKTFDRQIEETIDYCNEQEMFGERRSFLLMFDLDHFKNINDTYGHLCGDQVLLAISAILQKYTDGKGRAYRYGGEEFAVILEPCKKIEAYSVSEQIRRLLKERTFDFDVNKKMSVSIGAIWYEKGWDSKKWIAEADKLLYHAKNSGRDRVVIKPDIVFSDPFKK